MSSENEGTMTVAGERSQQDLIEAIADAVYQRLNGAVEVSEMPLQERVRRSMQQTEKHQARLRQLQAIIDECPDMMRELDSMGLISIY